jgi:ubiquitin C-terminal hydrolase
MLAPSENITVYPVICHPAHPQINPQAYHYYDSRYVAAVFGMNNTGVICWFNSLLQLLLSLPALNMVVLESDHAPHNIFAIEYAKLVKLALSDKNKDILLPASGHLLSIMMNQIKLNKPTLTLGRQQECVDEGITIFIELLNNPAIEQLFSNIYEITIECDSCGRVASSVRDKSFRIQMFTQELLEDQEIFTKYLRSHTSELDRYHCKCGHVMNHASRTERLKMLREIIIIIFNKFAMKKVRWFPQTLTFKTPSGSTLCYQLVAKIEHAGTQMSGHYWAQVYRGAQWYNINDSSTRPGNGLPLAETFMVAYHLVSDV